MQADESRFEYERRLNLVVNHVVEHLDESMSLEDLAGVAAWSPFHFHRIFKAMMGETLGEYVWRLRLERAAFLLRAQKDVPITCLALDCGFATPSSFARAFRERFGVTASAYRAGHEPRVKPVSNLGKVAPGSSTYALENGPDWPELPRRSMIMDVTVREIPAYRVAYVRRLGYAKGVYQEHLNQAFQQVCGWVGKQELFGPDSLIIGIPHDNPDITPNDRCRYDACVTIPGTITEGGDGVDIQDLRGGQYAVCRIDVEHPAEIGHIVTALYGEWLPSSGYRADDRPCLEIYRDEDSDSTVRRIVLDYCLPVVAL